MELISNPLKILQFFFLLLKIINKSINSIIHWSNFQKRWKQPYHLVKILGFQINIQTDNVSGKLLIFVISIRFLFVEMLANSSHIFVAQCNETNKKNCVECFMLYFILKLHFISQNRCMCKIYTFPYISFLDEMLLLQYWSICMLQWICHI